MENINEAHDATGNSSPSSNQYDEQYHIQLREAAKLKFLNDGSAKPGESRQVYVVKGPKPSQTPKMVAMRGLGEGTLLQGHSI